MYLRTFFVSPKLCSLIASFLAPSSESTPSATPTSWSSTNVLHALKGLLALSRTCRAFHSAATPLLYRTIVLSDPQRVLDFARSVLKNGRLAGHVKTFAFVQPPSPSGRKRKRKRKQQEQRMHELNLGQEFWSVIHLVVDAIQWNVEVLVLSDSSGRNTFIFVPPGFPAPPHTSSYISLSSLVSIGRPLTSRYQYWTFPALHTLKLRFAWDVKATTFIARLSSYPSAALRTLYFDDTSRVIESNDRHDSAERIEPGHFPLSSLPPNLTTFSGAISTALQFFPPPPTKLILPHLPLTHPLWPRSKLAHLQLVLGLDAEGQRMQPAHVVRIIRARFGVVAGTLRALRVLDLPDEEGIVEGLLGALCATVPNIRHLGLLSYPEDHEARHRFHAHLVALRCVHTLEVGVSGWFPTLTLEDTPAQGAVVAELHACCPSLRTIVLWMGGLSAKWVWDRDAAGAALGPNASVNGNRNMEGKQADGGNVDEQQERRDGNGNVRVRHEDAMSWGTWCRVVDPEGHLNQLDRTMWCEA